MMRVVKQHKCIGVWWERKRERKRDREKERETERERIGQVNHKLAPLLEHTWQFNEGKVLQIVVRESLFMAGQLCICNF